MTCCSAGAGVAGAGVAGAGVAGTVGMSVGAFVSTGDELSTSPANGDGPIGSEASSAASLAGLSAIGLGAIWPTFPEEGTSVSTCLSDVGFDEPLMEVESESRSRSEGVGDEGRNGRLNAVDERRTTCPTRPHRDFFAGDDEESGGGVV